MTGSVDNNITGGFFFSDVIQGRDITVQLPAEIPPALSGLPAASSAFTGRSADMDELLEALEPDPDGVHPCGARPVLVTAVSGMGGVGKTELAVQVAHRAVTRSWFPGGVLFVDMLGYDPDRSLRPSQALQSFLRALGIADVHIPAAQQDQSRLFTSVLTAFAEQDRRILVVIDNAATDEQVKPLLPTDSANSAIVTSRDTLAMLDARLIDLDVLNTHEAVKLTERILHVARPGDTRVATEPEAAALIAEYCAGLPLALRIVAALLAENPARPLRTMAGDLRSEHTRLQELSYADLAVRAAFDLSYQRLEPSLARLFRLLPVNPGPDISTSAATALAGTDLTTTRRHLEALARAHLIEPGDTYGRWRMHDLMHLYARDLHESETPVEGGAIDKPLGRLLTHYLSTLRDARISVDPASALPGGVTARFRFEDRDEAMAWVRAEQPNLVAVVITAAPSHPQDAVSLALNLHYFLERWRYLEDLLATATVAAGLARRMGLADEFKAVHNLGVALVEVGDLEEAIKTHRRAVRMAQRAADRLSEARALRSLAVAFRHAQRFGEALQKFDQAAAIYKELRDRRGEASVLCNRGPAIVQAAQVDGGAEAARRFEQASADLQRAADLFHELGDHRWEGTAYNNRGIALRHARRFGEAIDSHQRAIDIARRLDDPYAEAMALDGLGLVLTHVDGRIDEAIAAHKQAATQLHGLADRAAEDRALTNLRIALAEKARIDGSG